MANFLVILYTLVFFRVVEVARIDSVECGKIGGATPDFYFKDLLLDYSGAEEECRRMKSRLVTILDDDKARRVKNFLNMMGIKSVMWLGLRRRRNDNEFIWRNVDSADIRQLFTNWAEPRELNDQSRNLECVVISSLTAMVQWQTENCEKYKTVLCELDPALQN